MIDMEWPKLQTIPWPCCMSSVQIGLSATSAMTLKGGGGWGSGDDEARGGPRHISHNDANFK